MNQPAVFISCVSPEFRQTRSRVAAILTRLGYTPVIQEIFGTEPDDLRQVLRDKIDATDLDLKIERLRDELAKLRQAFNIWQNKVLRDFAVVLVLLLLIGGSIW